MPGSALLEVAGPAGYRLQLPSHWCSLDLSDAEAGARDVERILARHFAGLDEASLAGVRADLEERARAAVRFGGIKLHLSLLPGDPVVVAASALVAVHHCARGPVELDVVARKLADGRADLDVLACGVGALAGQPAVRRQVRSAGAPPEVGCDYVLSVPQRPGELLLLSFRSPMEPIAAAMTAVFEEIAGTFRWE